MLNRGIVRAMFDTGVINNFMSQCLVGDLGLTVSKSSSKIKTVNSDAQPIQGTTNSSLKIGNWEKECVFMAVPLDNFDLILGIEFFVQTKAVAVPYLSGCLLPMKGVCALFLWNLGDEPI
ncbi:Aspartic peptidase domain containing protein [Parasponia andersonii]|uniref:Aspartic peptidase domain containing protein n=1 Tax=Parasponia andersonii TaxID=3476 RepID=A0A2P5DAF0_PARAD|nr:Aspartic peptidase domain containing protein [Parasponia andersonii]